VDNPFLDDIHLEMRPYEQGGAKEFKLGDVRSVIDRPVRLAITGSSASGTGKSALRLVNAFRGLAPGDEGAADEGVSEPEVLHEIVEYTDPTSTQAGSLRAEYITTTVTYTVLPSAGTEHWPPEGYVDKVKLGQHDALVIVTDDRVTEIDLHLLNTAKDLGVPTFLVRSKIDLVSTITESYLHTFET
jgi:hypothetical protein